MALLSSDERELLLPLAEGVHEDSLWETFLRRLAARTAADHVLVRIERDERNPQAVLVLRSGRVPSLRPDPDELSGVGLLPLADLRPGRVYALQEYVETEPVVRRGMQRAALKKNGVRYARAVRTAWREGISVCVLLFAVRRDFGAADSALLSELMPHLLTAARTLAVVHRLEQRAEVAEAALARLGIGQVCFDCEGRVLSSDDTARDILGERGIAGRWIEGVSDSAMDLADDGEAMPVAMQGAAGLSGGGGMEGHSILLRPAHVAGALAPPVAVIGQLRGAARANSASVVGVLRHQYGLSEREAALAVAISRGEAIVDAGRQLGLTSETARNYSKRVYAKTGTRGQADLVRLVLTGLAALA